MTRIGGTTCGGRGGFRRALYAFKDEGRDGERANGEEEGGSGARVTQKGEPRGGRGSGERGAGAASGGS